MKGTLDQKWRVALIAAAAAIALTGGARAEDSESAPTFYRDVLPIFQQHCNVCHHEGALAPMALDTYQSTRPWARSIQRSLGQGEMPPWDADPRYEHFSNENRLSEEDLATVLRWTMIGAPAGNPEDAPAPQTWDDEGWVLGKPDIILSMAEPYTVPAEGPDEYKYFRVPTNFTEDTWVSAVEIMPGNRQVVHHVIAFVSDPDNPDRHVAKGEGGVVATNSYRPESDAELQKVIDQQERLRKFAERREPKEKPLREMGMIGGMAPGMPPWESYLGEARLIPAGSELVLQMHYHPSGTEGTDVTSIGLKVAKGSHFKRRHTTGIFNVSFAIPPGADDYEVLASHKIDEDITVYSFMPHMHLRGKSFSYTAVLPDGTERIMLSVPRYRFDWQLAYELAEPIQLPQGTVINCRATFDNSTGNPDNPDPQAIVRFGEPTVDEMMIGWFDYTRDADISGIVG